VAAAIVSLDHPRVARAFAVVLVLLGATVAGIATFVVATELLGEGMSGLGRDIGNLATAGRAGALALFFVVAAIAMWRYAGEEGEAVV
jgi:hypothetical protein